MSKGIPSKFATGKTIKKVSTVIFFYLLCHSLVRVSSEPFEALKSFNFVYVLSKHRIFLKIILYRNPGALFTAAKIHQISIWHRRNHKIDVKLSSHIGSNRNDKQNSSKRISPHQNFIALHNRFYKSLLHFLKIFIELNKIQNKEVSDENI